MVSKSETGSTYLEKILCLCILEKFSLLKTLFFKIN